MIEIPGYRIVRTLGQGGMATVYLAIQESFEREVALKILSGDLAKDPTFSERFLREAKIVSRLVHPNIVTVYDVGIESGQHFLSMEYIPGADLKQVRCQQSLAERLNTIKDIARALSFSGKKGYVHRDVKPENIMLHADSGRAVLMDFGIARPSDAVSSMTQTGTAIGTPHYMSPEQARGQVVDPRSDLYSLGVVLFLMLTGHVPFDADSAVAVGIKHVSEPTPLMPPHLGAFQGIINKILSKDPEHRYQTGEELIADLDAILPEVLNEVTSRESEHEQAGGVIEVGIDTSAATLVGHATIAMTPPPAPAQSPPPAQPSSPKPQPADLGISVISEDRVVYHEEESGSLWPWVSAVMLAAGVVFAVYYQQQLPAEYRWFVASDAQELERPSKILGSAPSAEEDEPQEVVKANGGELSRGLPVQRSALKKGEGVAIVESVPRPEMDAEVNTEEVAKADSAGVERTEAEPEVMLTVAKPAMVASAHIPPRANTDPKGGVEVGNSGQSAAPVSREARLAEAAEWVVKGFAEPKSAITLIPQAADRYRQLLGRNPADSEARQGLKQLREAIQKNARLALDKQRFSDVEQLLALAESTFPKASSEPKFQRLQKRMQQAVSVRKLLGQARTRIQANALTTPVGNNAAEYFKQVLAIKPDHPLATKGLEDIVKRYTKLAIDQLDEGQLDKASGLVTRGLGVDASNTELKAIAARIEQRNLLAETLQQAEQLLQQGKVLKPAGDSALDAYRKVLAVQPQQPQALAALVEMEDDLVAGAESFISSRDYQQATAEISRALFFFPESQTLQGLQRINEQAIADMIEASQPKISKVLVSNRVMASLADKQQQTLAVDRILHVGFYFKNFEAATSVVQAVLFDGARSLQIAQVPVIVSGQEGAQFFRIERPVEGFSDGGYSIDLILEGQRLSSAAFEVGNRSEL